MLYAVNIPFSKLLLTQVQPAMMAAFLYLGAGMGQSLYGICSGERKNYRPLTGRDFPYVLGMILLDIAAPILLMLGLAHTGAANASLLNNFEIVATSLIAFFLFREVLSRRLVFAILLITLASLILGYEGQESLRFHSGSLLVLGAACCWGLENNCTRMLSAGSSVQITAIKGIFSGLGSLCVALIAGETFPDLSHIALVLALGYVSYGLSINFYIKAQKELGAAKTSAYYSIAPFLGVIFGILLLSEQPKLQFLLGLVLMIAATVLLVRDTIHLQHTHEHTHTHDHVHRHGSLVHSHTHSHVHSHTHIHGENAADHSHDHGEIESHDHMHGEKTES